MLICPNCGYRFNDEEPEADITSDDSDTCQDQERPAGKRRFKVSFACRPYCVQMFKADEELKRRCLEAAANDEEEYERFDEMKFHVIRYDDFAYQTSEIIGVRFRLENGEIIITAYYDDDSCEIVEDCELYFNYDYAENYNAVAFCIETIEKELGL